MQVDVLIQYYIVLFKTVQRCHLAQLLCGPVTVALLYLYHIGTRLLLEFEAHHVFENGDLAG